MISWLQIVVGSHIYANEPVTVSEVLLGLSIGLFFGACLSAAGEKWREFVL